MSVLVSAGQQPRSIEWQSRCVADCCVGIRFELDEVGQLSALYTAGDKPNDEAIEEEREEAQEHR